MIFLHIIVHSTVHIYDFHIFMIFKILKSCTKTAGELGRERPFFTARPLVLFVCTDREPDTGYYRSFSALCTCSAALEISCNEETFHTTLIIRSPQCFCCTLHIHGRSFIILVHWIREVLHINLTLTLSFIGLVWTAEIPTSSLGDEVALSGTSIATKKKSCDLICIFCASQNMVQNEEGLTFWFKWSSQRTGGSFQFIIPEKVEKGDQGTYYSN